MNLQFHSDQCHLLFSEGIVTLADLCRNNKHPLTKYPIMSVAITSIPVSVKDDVDDLTCCKRQCSTSFLLSHSLRCWTRPPHRRRTLQP